MTRPRKSKPNTTGQSEDDGSVPIRVRNAAPEIIYRPPDSDEDSAEVQETITREADMEVDVERRPECINNAPNLHRPVDDETGIAQIALFISMFSSVFFSLSRFSSDILLRLLKSLVGIALKSSISENQVNQIMENIPIDSRTVRSRFDLSGRTTEYAVCPKCNCLYEPEKRTTHGPQANDSPFPKLCSNRATPSSERCDEPLLGEDNQNPVKKFVYNSVVDFIGGLVSRQTTERFIDDSCDKLRCGEGTEMRGPFEADFLLNFYGHERGVLFVERGSELRLMFSLNVNFFNKEGARSSAASVSCGAMTLACLNLPEDIRYKDENMFLAGIIPGPKEPKPAEINHYLSPLVKEFLTLWDPGIRFSQTASTQHGRLARAAIALVVCDLPAARKVAGLYSFHSRDFLCSSCLCPKSAMGDVSRTYEERNASTMREHAMSWLVASSEKERDDMEKRTGVRWSELWRLPYWDPTKQLVVDPMHCLLLGLVQNHFTTIFPLKDKVADAPSVQPPYEFDFRQMSSDGKRVPIAGKMHPIKESDAQAVQCIHKMLLQTIDVNDVEAERTRLRQRLEKQRKIALLFVSDSLGLGTGINDPMGESTKQEYADALTEWRFQKPLNSPIKLTTTSLMKHIRHIIKITKTPSFVHKAPHNFGERGSGKIKADEWRTLCTIHLPLALISYCFYSPEIQDSAYRERFLKVINHTMHLVQAIKVLFKESTSANEIERFRYYVTSYMGSLEEVHPEAKIVPSMHMATHIPECARRFGSVYSWWTFPFERLIGRLQNIQTSSRTGKQLILTIRTTALTVRCTGQFEATMLNTFIATSRLAQRFSRDGQPPGIEDCLAIIDDMLAEDRETPKWDGSILPPVNLTETPEVMHVLQAYSDRLDSRCKWKGAQYDVRNRHEGNSQIIYRPKDGIRLAPGFIEYIVAGDNPLFIVRPLLLTSDDPFDKYPDAPMRTFFIPHPQPPLEVVDCQTIVGHFASLHLADNFYTIIPLCKI
ncbi:hypothetical protein ACEPAH_1672 [Sanghuangporus vaninii]